MYFRTPHANLRFLASMHMVPASDPDLPDWALQAYDWSECLVFESEIGPQVLTHFTAQDSAPLDRKVSREVHAGLSQLWASNTNLPALDSLRPWAAAMLSATTLCPMALGIEPLFLDWATEEGKPIDYLEPPSAFPTLADAIPIDTIERTLGTMLANLESARKSQLNMHKAWAAHDRAGFDMVARELPLLREPQIKGALLDRRNEAWAPKLRELMNCQRRTLVAVGALHIFVPPTAQQLASIELHAL